MSTDTIPASYPLHTSTVPALYQHRTEPPEPLAANYHFYTATIPVLIRLNSRYCCPYC